MSWIFSNVGDLEGEVWANILQPCWSLNRTLSLKPSGITQGFLYFVRTKKPIGGSDRVNPVIIG